MRRQTSPSGCSVRARAGERPICPLQLSPTAKTTLMCVHLTSWVILTSILPAESCSSHHPRYFFMVQGTPGWSLNIAEVVINAFNEDMPDSTIFFAARKSLTPAITGIVPSRGTTAGGADVTIFGTNFGSTSLHVSVSIGGFKCNVGTLADEGGGVSSITCVTGASGPENGGVKYVTVSVDGVGTSLRSENATYWYIDAWSARTTWGGGPPPTGCGAWKDDNQCKDTVIIPAGQTVLLDISPPRFYLILIEGTLIFDRKNIHLQAGYILVRGGTLQIGTELEPFMQQAKLTLYGNPQSIDLPTFGSKCLACFECKMDLHGAPQISWTMLTNTIKPGDTVIEVQHKVAWPLGSKVVIATTDYELPTYSHSEVATVAELLEGGKKVRLENFNVCRETSEENGVPLKCSFGYDSFQYMHLAVGLATMPGQPWPVEMRAEVGLLTRNIVIEGDHDEVLCPNPEMADDGVTKLSCNMFGVQLFLHSPGHESLVARIANVEVRNAGQAFRLGKYGIHWHQIGNLRESFQRNMSIHHSWNRGTAVHGVNYLRVERNFLYSVMGHSFFIEDGIEEYNVFHGNLGIKSLPSMSLLNTDQTPALFWIVSTKNYITENHAVASRRYGIWVRPERSATGGSINTPMPVAPWNIPVLEFRGNVAHSNSKYGLRIFDIFQPNAGGQPFRDQLTWRNGKSGFVSTVIGKIAFEGFVSLEEQKATWEARVHTPGSWTDSYMRNCLFVANTGHALTPNMAGYSGLNLDLEYHEYKGKNELGLFLPWNGADTANSRGEVTWENGGFVFSNITFINFTDTPCMVGCAHCGLGGAPGVGDGAAEYRFANMSFINSPAKVVFRAPTEAFFYDLDGSLTGTGAVENYTKGGNVVGSSYVGMSPLLDPTRCTELPNTAAQNKWSSGNAVALCRGEIFRKFYSTFTDAETEGKAMCFRPSWGTSVNLCQNLTKGCNCHMHVFMSKANIIMLAVGKRYEAFINFRSFEGYEPMESWVLKPQNFKQGEKFYYTARSTTFSEVDRYGRNLDYMKTNLVQTIADNYYNDSTYCDWFHCGYFRPRANWNLLSPDPRGMYDAYGNVTGARDVAMPLPTAAGGNWALTKDTLGGGALITIQIPFIQSFTWGRKTVIHPLPPPPPETPPPSDGRPWPWRWTDPRTWYNLTDSVKNPMNIITARGTPSHSTHFFPAPLPTLNQHIDARSTAGQGIDVVLKLVQGQNWTRPVPSDGDNVWIPSYASVVWDAPSGLKLNRLVVQGTLFVNQSDMNLSVSEILSNLSRTQSAYQHCLIFAFRF